MRLLPTLTIAAALLGAAAPAARAGHQTAERCTLELPHRCTVRTIPGHYETRQEQVWVPGRWVIEQRQVVEPGRWEVVYEEITIPGRYETVTRQVWVPGHWEIDRSCAACTGASVGVELGRVHVQVGLPIHTCTARRRWVPGHYETRCERVWIPPRCERRPVRKWIPPCTRVVHERVYKPGCYETRTVRVWVPPRTVYACRPAPSLRHDGRREVKLAGRLGR
ncbi:MAG: hypothetical protein KatS3mg102_1970 [Planctomycetota bacterium]|nr:MAG: hypothetical protein KatS3mg102_1970 [Planctomycetota bacterium]